MSASPLIRNEDFELAFRFVTETDQNIFLTGKAGTGKTTFLKYLRANCFKHTVVAAPTGVAAINAGGVTLHSLFQLPFGPYIPTEEGANQLLAKTRFFKDKINLLRSIELLIIDEASMVAMYMVDAIDTILKSVRRKHYLPFGGVQVLFIGDLHQLQPVVKHNEMPQFKDHYSSTFFFESKVLRAHPPLMIEFKEIFRQQDSHFIKLLNEIRNNELTQENIDLLNTRLDQHFDGSAEENYITLTTHNEQADKINRKKLDQLPGEAFVYSAVVHEEFPDNMFPADAQLELKEGAQVMFLKNDTQEKRYFNGKIGVVEELGDEEITVRCDNELITVAPYEWKNIRYSFDSTTRELNEKELGSFIQFPLRLAWAITIHKSQGLTFDKLIIDAENAFANGQVYVALSRATSLEGLVLTSQVNRRFLGAQQQLKDWQQNNQRENLPQHLENERNKYMLKELNNSFSLSGLGYSLKDLSVVIAENKDTLPSESMLWIERLQQQQKSISQVASKFQERLQQLAEQNFTIEENQPLQQRLKDAAAYFTSELTKLKTEFIAHPLATDTKQTAKQFDKLFETINVSMHEILHRMEHFKNGFVLDEFLKKAKKFSGTITAARSTYGAKQKAEQENAHPELYKRLAAERKRIGEEENLPLFTIFHNATIDALCISLPSNKQQLLQVKGFGKKKVEKYGELVLSVISSYQMEK